ncbi:MAG TPA: hypothetical protein VFX03_01855, partial [Thermomicrobiales bacterium]|nr:hypothetical protein [Thermomicrobiales bacterium]
MDATSFQVKAAVFNINGQVLTPNLTVSETAASNFFGTADLGLTALTDGGFVVTWQDDNNQDYFRVGSASGFSGHQVALPGTTMTDVAALADGGFVATYFRNDGGAGYFARVYDSSGAAVSPEFLAGPSFGFHSVTGLEDGRFMIVYEGAGGIAGRVWNADGTPESDEFTISSSAGGTRPDAETLADGTVAVSWQNGEDIFYTVVDPREDGIQLAGTPVDDSYTGTRFDDLAILGDGNDAIAAGDGV